MAGFAPIAAPQMANFGRSGYNKDGDNEDNKRNFGRSGYNKDDSDDDKRCFGRSGYNKDGDEEDSRLSVGSTAARADTRPTIISSPSSNNQPKH
ncbi:hypothetical protein F4805DRAFT_456752 [Annulohypoxylon moriforme]|nr:hypothetical protein F4805DRAFT_456752 [Annulohypoxylon moriforme]